MEKPSDVTLKKNLKNLFIFNLVTLFHQITEKSIRFLLIRRVSFNLNMFKTNSFFFLLLVKQLAISNNTM